MRCSFAVPILCIFIGVFLISGGVGLRSINVTIPTLGVALGLLFFLLAGHLSKALSKKEEYNVKEN